MAGITDTGFDILTEEELFDQIVADLRATISPSLSFADDTPEGQLTGVISAKLAEIWEALLAVREAATVRAEGAALDDLAAITGTVRRDATYSTAVLEATFSGGFSVPVGALRVHVAGNPNAIFANTNAQGSLGGGVRTFQMVAEATGPTQAPAGTLTEVIGTVTNLVSVTNPDDAVPGQNQEDDASLRLRREAERAAVGSCTVDAIRAALLRTTDVISAGVLENDTNASDGNGLPPHSFECIVLGGAAADIAATIWANKPAGIQAFGATFATIQDSEGHDQDVYYSTPTVLEAHVAVEVTVNPTIYPADGDDQIKAALAAFTNGSLTVQTATGVTVSGQLNVGTDLILAALHTAIYTVPGVVDVPEILAGYVDPPTLSNNLVVGAREVIGLGSAPGLQTANIDVSSSTAVDL